MLGQSFFPGGDEQQRLQQEGTGPVNPVQEAIKVLSLKLPRVLGAGAPAPPQLLTGLGGAGMPTGMPGPGQPENPLVTILQRLFMPGAQMGGGPQAPAPGMPPSAPPPSSDAFKPKVEYMPNPGGTAGPDPYGRRPGPFSDLPDPLPAGPGKRPTSA